MLYKAPDGKYVEILRSHYKDDKTFYLAILKVKGFLIEPKSSKKDGINNVED